LCKVFPYNGAENWEIPPLFFPGRGAIFEAFTLGIGKSRVQGGGTAAMTDENNRTDGNHHKEEWIRLCELAAVEKDPEKLLVLCQTISRLLEEKEKALKIRP
jgi:hypothetical protein